MGESTGCPKCGIQLLADAPAGLCPKCLVQAGFESQPVPSSESGATVSRRSSSGFEPPAVEELAGKFPQLEILELLGKGGMGAVYKARQRGLDRLVAMKILPPEIGHDAAFAERFTREARALARLTHSHIVSVYDFGQVDGLFFIVMEHVDGVNLRQTIQSGGLSPADALAIVPQICEALQFAHDEGIVHRDIKPENILIDKRGRVKIADFGLAKLLGQDASDHSLTATHQVMGTPRYMAPEQMQGSREVDHRVDIYSLGVVFYELLTGELPMGKFAPPSKRVQVDVRLDEVVLRALEQDPEQRYQHASEVKTDVETISRSRQSLHAATLPSPETAPFPDLARAKGADVRRAVMKPALALLVTGGANLLFVVFFTYWFLMVKGFDPAKAIDWAAIPGALGLGWMIYRQIVGGMSLMNLESDQDARSGALWAIFLPLPPTYFIALPSGIWTLVVLSNPDVKAAFSQKRTSVGVAEREARPESAFGSRTARSQSARVETPQEQRESRHARWGTITAAALMIAGLIFSAFAMWVTGSVWCLLALCVPAFIAPGLENMARRAGSVWIFFTTAGLALTGSLALIAYGVWLTESLWPLFGIFAPFFGLVAGVSAWQGDEHTDENTGTGPVALPPAGLPSTRPKLVPVLATLNLVGAIVLMLVCAMEEPAAFAQPVLPVWHVWGKVDSVLGFAMAAGMFAASIGLFLWKPWARKLTLGVCVFGLASFVFDAPYLARFAIPDVYAEFQHTVAENGIEPAASDFVALFTVVVLVGGIIVVGLTWLIGQLVYFTRPRVVETFEPQRESYGKFLDWLFTGAGAVVGVLSVFVPLALLLGIAALFKGDGAWTIDSSAHPSGNRAESKAGEVWFGDEHVMFLGPNRPTVSDRLAGHLGLDPVQRAAMDQALWKFAAEFRSLQEQYTQTTIDENGHQITTIAPPPKQVAELVEGFWTGLEADLDGRQLTIGRKTLHLNAGMFAASDYGYRVEIWRVGQINPWYHWKELDPGLADFHSDQIKPSSGPELPERLRRFWKETESAATKVE